MLYVKELTAAYGRKTVLSKVSLELRRGEFVCLCGSNGSGKSTLLSLLAGLSDGSLKICSAKTPPTLVLDGAGTPVAALPRKTCARHIAYMQQNEFSVWDFCVRDVVLQGRFPYLTNGRYSKTDEEIAGAVMAELGLTELADRPVHQLSGGEYQKVRIARALAQTPDFLLFDEPASGLDFVYEAGLLQFLKKQAQEKNIGILLSIHDINTATRFAGRLELLTRNGLVSGPAEQVLTKENIKNAFGAECELFRHPVFGCVQVVL